ncbi:MAG TPA: GGDEF domain-containing protein, partial [Bacillota bacterium]|nr:GGDEF domain-containing protein [Bacillota bacterium]
LFITVLMTVTSIEMQDMRERSEINRLLSELRMAHDFLKSNNRNLTHLALTDALTELYNYRFYETALADYFESAYRYGYSLSLLMIDVDHFKNLNDTFGHRTGDTTLKAIAHILQESVRKEDFVCRYGGEEFTVILPRTDLVRATDLAERICLAVRSYEYLGIGSERVTVSIGVSAFPEEANSIQELSEFADQALYEAKRNGRDCVIARRNIYTNLSL